MIVEMFGVDLYKCAVHNEPVLQALGKMTCVRWQEHHDLDQRWVGKSRTREIHQFAMSPTAPMYVAGDNGMIFKHRLSGWGVIASDEPEMAALHRRVEAQRRRLGVQPMTFAHLITRRASPAAVPVFDMYGPTYADAGSAILTDGRPVMFGIAESVRSGRAWRSGDAMWEHVEAYVASGRASILLPTKEMQKERVRMFWAQRDLETAQSNYARLEAQQVSEGRDATV